MASKIEDHFENGLNPVWEVTEAGKSVVLPTPGALRLTVKHAEGAYSNAQITDYSYDDFNLRWTPPVRMTVTAWAEGGSDLPPGTAGFGFWNHPFSPDAHRFPRFPQAIWFFSSGERSDMALAYGVPGNGWKAATLDTTQRQALVMLPVALPAALLMRIPALYARLFPGIQRRLHVAERLLDSALLTERHTYTIDWRPDGATFSIDGAAVFESPYAPRGPGGFVCWIDNRYAVVTPQGHFHFGITPVEQERTLVIEQIIIESL